MKVGDKVLCKKTYKSMCGGHKFQFKEGKCYEIDYIRLKINYIQRKKAIVETPPVITIKTRNKLNFPCQAIFKIPKKSWVKNEIFSDYFYTEQEIRKLKIKKIQNECRR